MKQPILEIEDLTAGVEGKQILKGINLRIYPGEVHAIMGPNGSGKSTLAAILAGRDGYEVTAGRVVYDGQDLLELAPEERAREGLFLAFQYPVEIPGVNSTYFLKSALNEIRKHRGQTELDAMEFLTLVKDKIQLLELKEDLLRRSVNEGFSGGEKKRNEIFQMAVLEPRLAVLDETAAVRTPNPAFTQVRFRARKRKILRRLTRIRSGNTIYPTQSIPHFTGETVRFSG